MELARDRHSIAAFRCLRRAAFDFNPACLADACSLSRPDFSVARSAWRPAPQRYGRHPSICPPFPRPEAGRSHSPLCPSNPFRFLGRSSFDRAFSVLFVHSRSPLQGTQRSWGVNVGFNVRFQRSTTPELRLFGRAGVETGQRRRIASPTLSPLGAGNRVSPSISPNASWVTSGAFPYKLRPDCANLRDAWSPISGLTSE